MTTEVSRNRPELPDRVSKKDRIYYKGMFVAANVKWNNDHTKPLFGQIDDDKVIDMIANRKCQLCGKRIAKDQFACFPGRFQLGTYSEAPLHIECCRYALSVCPMILRVKDDFGVAVCRDYYVRGGMVVPVWYRLPNWMQLVLSLAHKPERTDDGVRCSTCGADSLGDMNYEEFMAWSAR